MTAVLDVQDLTFSYPRRPTLLKGVSFSVDAGEVLCLLGPNGTGKTTLLRCLIRISKMSGGTVTIHGRDAHAIENDIGAGAGKRACVCQSDTAGRTGHDSRLAF